MLILQSVLYVLQLRHHVAPEKATQREKKKGEKRKEALPSDNTSAANLCKTPKAPSPAFVCLLSPRPSCRGKPKKIAALLLLAPRAAQPLGGSVCPLQEEAERAGLRRPGTTREPAHQPTSPFPPVSQTDGGGV